MLYVAQNRQYPVILVLTGFVQWLNISTSLRKEYQKYLVFSFGRNLSASSPIEIYGYISSNLHHVTLKKSVFSQMKFTVLFSKYY